MRMAPNTPDGTRSPSTTRPPARPPEPEQDRSGRAAGALAAPARQRHRQREQPEHRDEHAGQLVATEAPPAEPCRGVREDADPARGDALDEREWRERKRSDI